MILTLLAGLGGALAVAALVSLMGWMWSYFFGVKGVPVWIIGVQVTVMGVIVLLTLWLFGTLILGRQL